MYCVVGRALGPRKRALESSGSVPELAGRALKPAQKPLEPAERPFEASGEAGSHLRGPAWSSGGGRTEREIKKEIETDRTEHSWHVVVL